MRWPSANLGRHELLLLPLLLVLLYCTILLPLLYCQESWPQALAAYDHWREPAFGATLALTLAIGASLQLLLFWCTLVTSAVTTLIVGNLKAVTTTLLGFWLFGRVRLQWFGLAGVLINTLGGIMYSVFKFRESNNSRAG